MKKHRIILWMLILVTMLQLLASCASSQTEQPDLPQTDDPKPADELKLTEREDLYPEYSEFSKTATIAADKEIPANSIEYDVDISDVKDSEIILSASKLKVFDCRFPVKAVFSYTFQKAGEKLCTLKDFFGNVLYSTTIKGEAHETVTVELGRKNHPTGYFTLSCDENELNYVVTPPYDERIDCDKFAVDGATYYAKLYQGADINHIHAMGSVARLAGITWIRERAHWSDYEAVKGEYNYSSTDDVYTTLEKLGLSVVPTIYGLPSWTNDTNGVYSSFETSLIDAYNAAKETAIHYDGTVDAWELWNECDWFNNDMPESLMAWHKAMAIGIADSGADTLAVSGGLCELSHSAPHPDFVPLCFANGMMDYSDAFCYHNHSQRTAYPYTDFTAIDWAKQAPALISLYNTENRPVWVTEAGMKTNSIPASDDDLHTQAGYLVASTAQSFAADTDKHFWFVLLSNGESGGEFGMFSLDYSSPRPAIASEAVMTRMLGKAELIGEIARIPSKTAGYLFDTGANPTAVLWSNDGAKEYTFESSSSVIITDLMGNQTLVPPTDGKITVTLSNYPIYITYSKAPKDVYKRNWKETNTAKNEYSLGDRVIITPHFESYTLGDTSKRVHGHNVYDGIKISVRITNLNDVAVTGKLAISTDALTVSGIDNEIKIEPMSEVILPLTVEKVNDPTMNEYVAFSGTFNGEEASRSVVHVAGPEAKKISGVEFYNVFEGNMPKSRLSNIEVKLPEIEGELIVMIDDKVIDTYKQEADKLKIDLSGFGEGKYVLTVGIKTEVGYYCFNNLTVSYNGKSLVFS